MPAAAAFASGAVMGAFYAAAAAYIAVAFAGKTLSEPASAFFACGSVLRGPYQFFLTVSAYRADER